jgi:BASS family bile acid:Na+ symporter
VGRVQRASLFLSLACLAAALAFWAAGRTGEAPPAVVLTLVFFAVFVQGHAFLRAFVFACWVFAFIAAALFYPAPFRTWNGYDLQNLIVPIVQFVMACMGLKLSLGDFARALKMPLGVATGIALQFFVMPVVGWTIAKMLGFEPEVAAGLVLIGSVSGGVASNVMTYLARGNLALSVTMTACSTLLSPVLTPFAMKVLAGQYVPIPFVGMMVSIVKMVILPIAVGLAANKLLRGRAAWLDEVLPVASMAAICLVIAITTAASRDKLLEVGAALIVAAMLHNGFGYVAGYWGARLLGLNETDSRTVSIEVGLQNGGMAFGLAINVLRSSDAALAPAIFGPWMNISGSALAYWWRGRPGKIGPEQAAPQPASRRAPAASPQPKME